MSLELPCLVFNAASDHLLFLVGVAQVEGRDDDDDDYKQPMNANVEFNTNGPIVRDQCSVGRSVVQSTVVCIPKTIPVPGITKLGIYSFFNLQIPPSLLFSCSLADFAPSRGIPPRRGGVKSNRMQFTAPIGSLFPSAVAAQEANKEVIVELPGARIAENNFPLTRPPASDLIIPSWCVQFLN